MADQSLYWSRFWRQRHSRRRVLTTGAATGVGVAGFALVGCGDDDDDDDNGTASPTATSGGGTGSPTAEPSPTGGGAVQGGELVYSTGRVSTDSLDPHTTLNQAWTWGGFFTDKLVSPNHQTLEIEGELIESWEQVDDLTLTINVRQGVTFHDTGAAAGRPLVAEDIAYNLMRIAGKLDPDRSALFQRQTTLANMELAEAVDDSTVTVTFTAPNSQFMAGMADWRNWIVSQEGVDADPNFNDLLVHSATGPFIVDQWDAGQRLGEYIRNDNYWKDPAYLDRIRQVSLPDPAASQAAFISGDTAFYRAQTAEARAAVEGPTRVLASWEHVGWEYFRMNPNRGPMTDPQFRRAIFLALDIAEMMNFNYTEGFWDYTGPLVSSMPGAWTTDEVSQMLGFNPDTRDEAIAEARSLMEAAGYPDGDFTMEVVASPPEIVPWNANGHLGVDFIKEVWPDSNTTVRDSPLSEYFRELAGGDWDVYTYASFPPPSALVEGALHYRTGGGRNYTKYSNPDVDAIFEQAFAEFDSDARNELVGDLEQTLFDDIFDVPLGKARENSFHQSNIKGFEDGWQPGPGSFAAYDPVFGARHLWIDESA